MTPISKEEAAGFLRIGKTTLLRKLAAGEIPAAKVGREWVITREAVEQYLRRETERQTASRSVVNGLISRPRGKRRPTPPPSLNGEA